MSLGAACAPAPLPEGLFSIEFDRESEAFCAGSEAHLEDFILKVFEFLDEPMPKNFHIPVKVTSDSPCDTANCFHSATRTVYVTNVAYPGRVPLSSLRHEFVHAITAAVWGDSAPFFAEGIADVLARTMRSDYPDPAEMPEPIAPYLDKPAAEVNYTLAAVFARYFIDTHGLAAYKWVYQRAFGRSNTEIQALLAEASGRSFAALEAAFLASAPLCQYHLDICDPTAAIPVGVGLRVTEAVSCTDPAYYGGEIGDRQYFARQLTLDVETSGLYRLYLFYPVPSDSWDNISFAQAFSLHRCGGDCREQVTQWIYRLSSDHILTLESGLYTIEFYSAEESELQFELELLEASDDAAE